MARPDQTELIFRAVEFVSDIVEITDASFRLQYVNRAFTRITGYRPDEVIGRTPAAILRGQTHDPSFYEEIESTVLAGADWKGRIKSTGKNGRIITQEAFISPVLDSSGDITHFIAVKRDLTERARLQEQLLRADRLAAVARLGAAVGHEINNPLAYILSNLEYIQDLVDELGQDSPLVEEIHLALNDVIDGAGRVRDIVSNLARLARPGNELGAVDVAEAMDTALKVVAHQIRHRVRLVRDYEEVPPVAASEARLGQVFLNLVVNALHAMPVGRQADNELRIAIRRVDDLIAVTISDTGDGIAPEVVDHIFDPFFTTKPVGEGTGLGLAICHSVISELGGTIEVDSTPGSGTSFRLHLPLAPADPSTDASPSGAKLPEGLRILVIDDEVRILRAIRRLLPDCAVVSTTESTRALELLDTRRFDVVICDVMMPQMRGDELYGRIAKTHPELASRMLFITGGAFTKPVADFLDQVSAPTLIKPFDRQTLHAALLSLLTQPAMSGG